MKKHTLLTTFTLILGLSLASCDKKHEGNPLCQTFTLDKPFTAKLGETWCRDSWEITFGPLIEDSRCNVPDVYCVWAGQYVMEATIDNGEIYKDTFTAVNDWRDTLFSAGYTIILNKVLPETRPTTDPLDPSKYSFEVIIK